MKLQLITAAISFSFMILTSCATTPEERKCSSECERNNRECSDSCRGSYRDYAPADMNNQRPDNFNNMRSYDCMSQCDKQYYNCRDRCSKPFKLNTQP